ncbi:MAG: DUF6673 family protein [Culicoidibacterales bacterium]
MLTINGVELEFDIFDLDAAEAFESGLEAIKKSAETKNQNKTLSDVIRTQCALVFDVFDDIFGEGTAFDVFGEKTNLKVCLKAFEQLVSEVDEQRKAMEEETKKYMDQQKPHPVNRQQRRMGAKRVND